MSNKSLFAIIGSLLVKFHLVTVSNGGTLGNLCVETTRIDKRPRMNSKILLLPKKRTRTAFRSNFVNRCLKPPIITKKTKIWLKVPPFGTFTYLINSSFYLFLWSSGKLEN